RIERHADAEEAERLHPWWHELAQICAHQARSVALEVGFAYEHHGHEDRRKERDDQPGGERVSPEKIDRDQCGRYVDVELGRMDLVVERALREGHQGRARVRARVRRRLSRCCVTCGSTIRRSTTSADQRFPPEANTS